MGRSCVPSLLKDTDLLTAPRTSWVLFLIWVTLPRAIKRLRLSHKCQITYVYECRSCQLEAIRTAWLTDRHYMYPRISSPNQKSSVWGLHVLQHVRQHGYIICGINKHVGQTNMWVKPACGPKQYSGPVNMRVQPTCVPLDPISEILRQWQDGVTWRRAWI